MALAAHQENLEEKLREAARDGRTEEVISLLDVGVSVDATIEHGWTPLMWAAMYGQVGCVSLLLDRGAQPNLQDKDGRTPLMCASSTGHTDCVNLLLDRGAQATLQDKDGWTAMRYASSRDQAECMKVLLDRGAMTNYNDNVELIKAIRHGRVEEVRKLIEGVHNKALTPGEKLHDAAQHGRTEEVVKLLEDGVDIDTMNEVGESPLILAAGFGRVECVNLLLSRGAIVNHQDKIGNTALHWASLYSHIGSVRALLAIPGIDVSIQGNDGLIPLKMATKYEIIAMLKKYTTNCEDYPIHSFGKVILCGDTGSGKTTLAQAIKYIFKPRFGEGDMIHPGSVKRLTAGIVPHLIKNKEMNIMLFDLAGHHTYYSSHCAVLEAISLSPSTFLILVNLLQDIKDINKQLYYWSGMIGDVCHKCPQQSSVIVVGTHTDMITDRKLLESRCTELKKAARIAIKKHTFADIAALNAKAFDGEEMKTFMSLLCKTNNSVIANYPAISLNSHVMYAFLNDKVPVHQNVIPLSQLLTLLRKEEPKLLPTESTEVSPLLKTLAAKGFIVFFDGNMDDSWIVIHPEVLLEKVNGALFAPSSFEEHLPIASNTGVIPVVLLKDYFPEPTYNIDMIIQFLQLFELCIPITLNNVDTNMAPKIPPNTPSTDNIGPLLFFPACICVDRPAKVIPSCSFVWQICTASISQFFSPRCLHVLISRLAHCFALLGVEPSSIPELDRYNRRCSVWCKGIYWMTENAVMIVVEMKDDFRCLSCTIDTSDRSDPKYLLSVITFVKEVCNEFCPSVSLKEYISCPPEATSDHMPTTVELSQLKKVAQSKANRLIDTTGEKQVTISNWKVLEPQLFDLIGIDENEADKPAKRTRLDSYEECSEPSPRLADLLNDIASKIPAKWRDIGINLGLSPGILDNIQNQYSGKTDGSIRSFEQIFSMWKKQGLRPYTWQTLVDVLKTSTVNENDLAERMASKYIIESLHTFV